MDLCQAPRRTDPAGNAGLLNHGRYDRGTGEIIGPASWPAIIDEETWRAAITLLTDPARRRQQGNTIRWLGSGIYTCTKCAGVMRCTAIGGTAPGGVAVAATTTTTTTTTTTAAPVRTT